MLRLAVVGKDVSASSSPQMHTFILRGMGKRCSYEKVSVAPAEFSVHAEELFRRFDAFNVTIPFKGEIIPYLKELKGDARIFGAVNTVLARERIGCNTDGFGFSMMLENAGYLCAGKRVLVLGAGGAGRSCIKMLSASGAEVFVYERNEERLMSVYRELGGFDPLTEVPCVPYDFIVNCTGIGMHDTVGKTPTVIYEGGRVMPVGEELLSQCGGAVDLIYVPEESKFLRIARECGKPTLSGGAMLFYQAYCADCIILGRKPDPAAAKVLWEKYREENP